MDRSREGRAAGGALERRPSILSAREERAQKGAHVLLRDRHEHALLVCSSL